jgi:hypothetical protein
MISEKKDAANSTEYHLRKAHEHLNDAERYSQGTGDKTLHQQVTKIREAVVETRKDLSKKMDNHQS